MAADWKLPEFLRSDYAQDWHMTQHEKAAVLQLLDLVKPPVTVEVGTLLGGCLQVLAAHSGHVYSIDLNPEVGARLAGRFSNVSFLTGDSTTVLPALLAELEARGKELAFVLIDGDHSPEGVKRDVNSVLQYVPRRPLYVLMHDSFTPGCREGIIEADWEACPYVHHLDIDFVGGQYAPHLDLPPGPGNMGMWGGLGLAVMLPQRRTAPLKMREACKWAFEALYPTSVQARYARLQREAAERDEAPPPPARPAWLPLRALHKAVRILLGRSGKRAA